MKKKISAEIIADSKNEHGHRITTFVLTFPRFILAELNTHRMFSRNSASSRAIPFKKMLENVKNDPFIPIAFQKDHSGMQGTEYFEGIDHRMREGLWLGAAEDAAHRANVLNEMDVTKQLCNRMLEPYLWHTAIVTATEYENFFKLRCPQYVRKEINKASIQSTSLTENGLSTQMKVEESKESVFRSKKDFCKGSMLSPEDRDTIDWLKINKGAGEIHIMELAEQMWDAMNESTPKELKAGEFHIPFGDRFDDERLLKLVAKEYGWKYHGDDPEHIIAYKDELDALKVKIATARCARVSYENYEGGDDYEKDIKLHDRLSSMGHWSPFEHCAKAMGYEDVSPGILKLEFGENKPSEQQLAEFRRQWQELSKENSPLLITESEEVKTNYIPLNDMCGNFQGFIQYRKTFQNESGRN